MVSLSLQEGSRETGNDNKNEAEFLGTIVVVMSISINPDNTETISKWFVPKENTYQIYIC
jgi:hypothetical protein